MRGLITFAAYAALRERKIISLDFIHCRAIIPAFPRWNGILTAESRKNSSTVRLQAQPAGGGEKERERDTRGVA